MSREPEHLNTGTGASRRRLTEQEAKRGALPTPFTSEEWTAMKTAVTVRDIAMLRERARVAKQVSPKKA